MLNRRDARRLALLVAVTTWVAMLACEGLADETATTVAPTATFDFRSVPPTPTLAPTARTTQLPAVPTLRSTAFVPTATAAATQVPTASPPARDPSTAEPFLTPTTSPGRAADRTSTPAATVSPPQTLTTPTAVPTVAAAPTQTSSPVAPTATTISVVTKAARGAADGLAAMLADPKDYVGAVMEGPDGTYLGLLVPAERSFDSVCNSAGPHGSVFGKSSIFNTASRWGGQFGANSPFNSSSESPPRLIVDGVFAGHLSTSPFVDLPVDPAGVLDLIGCAPR